MDFDLNLLLELLLGVPAFGFFVFLFIYPFVFIVSTLVIFNNLELMGVRLPRWLEDGRTLIVVSMAISMAITTKVWLDLREDTLAQKTDPIGYAQQYERYYRIVALEEGYEILEDPNSGGLYVRQDGSEVATPLFNPDGTSMTAEDWKEVKN